MFGHSGHTQYYAIMYLFRNTCSFQQINGQSVAVKRRFSKNGCTKAPAYPALAASVPNFYRQIKLVI
jgi:hypothetical protein